MTITRGHNDSEIIGCDEPRQDVSTLSGSYRRVIHVYRQYNEQLLDSNGK
ncbi:MAG TPA: hypothetical protein VFA48_02795 [Gammaproteobacteria bacterium]|nr:hypothetical protein [Gammaproteobacteria bacterium]